MMLRGRVIGSSENKENSIAARGGQIHYSGLMLTSLNFGYGNFCMIYYRLKLSYILMMTLKSCNDGTSR